MIQLRKKQPKISINAALLICLFLLCSAVFADSKNSEEPEDSQGVKEKIEVQKLRFLIGAGGVNVKYKTSNTKGVTGHGAFLISLSDRFQTGFGMTQGFLVNPFGTLFTSIDIRLGFALTGSFILRRKITTIGEKDVAVSSDQNCGGLRIHGMLSQYFLRLGSTTSLSYGGFGGSLSYDLPSSDTLNYYIGIRGDRVTNGGTPAYPLQGFFGVAIWL